jgi:hypothetical protein
MLEEALLALAGAAGGAIVKSMATDAWTAVRTRVAGLFSRAGKKRQQVIEAQLDHDSQVVASSVPEQRAAVERELTLAWRGQLVELLADRPDEELSALADDLRALVEAADGETPVNVAHQSITGSSVGRDAIQLQNFRGGFTTGRGNA